MESLVLQVSRDVKVHEMIDKTLVPLVTSAESTTTTATGASDGDNGDRAASSSPPLRTIYWLVTNYAKKHAISHMVDNQPINIYNSYGEWIDRGKRATFDVYRRGPCKVVFTHPRTRATLWTTVAQLNFARWAHQFYIIDYTVQHLDAIQRDRDAVRRAARQRRAAVLSSVDDKASDDNAAAAATVSSPPAAPRIKRQKLSSAPLQSAYVFPTRTEKMAL